MIISINKNKFDHTGNVFFTSDQHFNHKNIIKYCNRPFSSVSEMNEKLIENWNNVVSDSDIVFHLGDFAFGGSSLYKDILDRLNGSIYLILGNHDNKALKNFKHEKVKGIGQQMLIEIDNQRIYLNHYPFLCYAGSNKGVWQLFGHVHSGGSTEGFDIPRLQYLMKNQYDVGVDNNNYTPISFTQLKDKFNGV